MADEEDGENDDFLKMYHRELGVKLQNFITMCYTNSIGKIIMSLKTAY